MTNPLTQKSPTKQALSGPSQSEYLLAPELLRLDIDQLVQSVADIHPEAYSTVSKDAFMASAESLKQSIYYPMSRSEFFLRVAPLVASMKDIHSFINLPYKSLKDNEEHPPPNQKLFPLAVLYEQGGLYVAADLSSNPKMPIGAQITSVNDIPIEFILQKMSRIVSWETDTGMRRKIQIEFPWLLAVLGYSTKHYQIQYQLHGRLSTLTLQALPPLLNQSQIATEASNELQNTTQVTSSSHDETVESQNSYYGFSSIDEQTGLLWFNDFYQEPTVFETFLTRQFKQFKQQGVTNLILDLRYNDGGRSQNIKSLLSFISNRPIYWSHRAEIKVSEPLKNLHSMATEKRRRNKYSWGLQWLPLEWTDWLQYEISWSSAGEWVFTEFEPIQPAEDYFSGNLKVLTNGFCYSACAAFIATINANQLAETIGETAGSVARIQYVYPISTLLKHSKLTLTLPTVKVYHEAQQTSRQIALGVTDKLVRPKVEVQRTIFDIAARKDTILYEAVRRIKSAQNESF